MKIKKMTHKGLLLGLDARTPKNYSTMIELRETPKFWASIYGTKYRKQSGYPAGDTSWPLYRLDTDSVKRISHDVTREAKEDTK